MVSNNEYTLGPSGELVPLTPAAANAMPTDDFRYWLKVVQLRGVNPHDILGEAYAIAHEHGLHDWNIRLVADLSHVRPGLHVYGTCNASAKTIELSLREMCCVDEARSTVRHELAHALQSIDHGLAHAATLDALKRQHDFAK